MSMQNVSCCEGCFYAGKVDGYRPECNCKYKETIDDTMELASKESLMDAIPFVSDLTSSPLCDETTMPASQVKKATSRQRRINKAKCVKRNARTLPIVLSKLDNLPSGASHEDFLIADRKVVHVSKTVKFRYQMLLVFSFPEIPEKQYGKTIYHLIDKLRCWQRDKDLNTDSNMVLACKNAVETLNTAITYGGELCSLHRKGNDMHITVGFLDKASLSNFKRKLSI